MTRDMMKVGRRAEESKHGDTTNDKGEPKLYVH